jgi:hypothetical protein
LKAAEFSAAKSMIFKDGNFNLLCWGHTQGKMIGQFHTSLQQTSPYFLPVLMFNIPVGICFNFHTKNQSTANSVCMSLCGDWATGFRLLWPSSGSSTKTWTLKPYFSERGRPPTSQWLKYTVLCVCIYT